jgi:hypothetical protein
MSRGQGMAGGDRSSEGTEPAQLSTEAEVNQVTSSDSSLSPGRRPAAPTTRSS